MNNNSPSLLPTKDKSPRCAVVLGSAALDKKIRKAFEADMQQYFIDALTPDRGYATPIDNLRKLIVSLLPNIGSQQRAQSAEANP
jgi:hypothetical protein